MYLSILGGALWGVPVTAPLICLVRPFPFQMCMFNSRDMQAVATGSLLCYTLSAAFGPALLSVPKMRARIESFAAKVQAQRANLLSYLIILR